MDQIKSKLDDLSKALFWNDKVDAQDISAEIFKLIFDEMADNELNIDLAIIEANQKIMNLD